MENDSRFIAFWELHEIPDLETFETNLSKAAGLPDYVNHVAFDVADQEELDRRRQQWLDAGLSVMEIDHNWCRSIYTRDPNDNLVEFCLTTGAFSRADRDTALAALERDDIERSAPPASVEMHEAATRS